MRISDWSSDVCSSDLIAKFWTLCQSPREPKGDFDEDFEQNCRCGNLQCVRCAGASLRTGILCSSQTRSAFGPAGSSCCLGDRSVGFLVDYLQRSEEHTSELQSLMRNSYAVFCLKNKTT